MLRTLTKDMAFGIAAAALAIMSVPAPAAAGQTPGVFVDERVLEDLGRPQTVPDLLFPAPSAPQSRLYGAPAATSDASDRRLIMPKPGVKPHSRLEVAAPAEEPAEAPADAAERDIPEPAGEMAVESPSAPETPQPETAPPETSPPDTSPADASDRPAPAAADTAPAETTPAPEPAEEAGQTAPAQPSAGADGLTIPFESGSAELSDDAKADLDRMAQRLQQDESLRVQVLAYAGNASDDSSRARRLSLSRALAVRAHLMDQGINSTRIEVRALGDKAGGGAPDRVDVKESAT